jgi:hypothetical protein
MAKDEKVNKTQLVRDYFKANPKASNKDVAEMFTKKGIPISALYVANIKATTKKKRHAVKRVSAQTGVGIAEIKAAFALLKACGSAAAAKQALSAAEDIQKLV